MIGVGASCSSSIYDEVPLESAHMLLEQRPNWLLTFLPLCVVVGLDWMPQETIIVVHHKHFSQLLHSNTEQVIGVGCWTKSTPSYSVWILLRITLRPSALFYWHSITRRKWRSRRFLSTWKIKQEQDRVNFCFDSGNKIIIDTAEGHCSLTGYFIEGASQHKMLNTGSMVSRVFCQQPTDKVGWINEQVLHLLNVIIIAVRLLRSSIICCFSGSSSHSHSSSPPPTTTPIILIRVTIDILLKIVINLWAFPSSSCRIRFCTYPALGPGQCLRLRCHPRHQLTVRA